MATYKYLDATHRVVAIIDGDGISRSSCLTLAIADWIAEGGTVLTEDPPPPPTQEDLDIAAAKAYAKLTALKAMTPAQVQAWVIANVTNLAQAQDAIATLAIGLSILARRL